MFKIRIVKRPPSAAESMKQINFGTAVGLTNTAKEAQKEVVGALKGTFTLRGSWFQQSNKFGIKITPATKTKLSSEVKTAASWLEPHETGTDKVGKRSRLAVPTAAMRPRGSRKILGAALRPRALLAAGKAFILDTKRGEVIAMLKGKGQKLVILYGLEPKVKIKKRSTFKEPIEKVVKKSLRENIRKGIIKAFATRR